MERYCGVLQPAIRSRRHPFATLNRYVLDDARLKHIKVLYPAAKESLTLKPADLEGYSGAICVRSSHGGSCKPSVVSFVQRPNRHTDETFALLPSHRVCTFERGVTDKIISMLCTRYTTTRRVIREVLPQTYEEWARLKIEPDGDIVHAAAYHQDDMTTTSTSHDSRNATFVRVSFFCSLPYHKADTTSMNNSLTRMLASAIAQSCLRSRRFMVSCFESLWWICQQSRQSELGQMHLYLELFVHAPLTYHIHSSIFTIIPNKGHWMSRLDYETSPFKRRLHKRRPIDLMRLMR